MSAVYITGLGAFLPNAPIDNDHIEDVLGAVNERSSQVKQWMLSYNGIEKRHYALDPPTQAPTHTNAEMTRRAVDAALRDAGVAYADLECLACGTASPDQILPNHGVMVHGLLGGHPLEVASTTGICCSGMAAFKYAFMNVACGFVKTACATGSELASPALRAAHFRSEMEKKRREDATCEPVLALEHEFLRWMLSDGAGAAVISSRPRSDGLSLRVDWIEFASYAHEAPPCMYFGCVRHEDGTFESVRLVDDPERLLQEGLRKACLAVRAKHDLRPDDVDWLLPHYSAEWFRRPLFDGLAQAGFLIPEERWFTNLKSKGNTGSASIYIILEEMMASGRVRAGDRLACLVPESSRFSFAVLHLTAVAPPSGE
jgi:3-oxoacyl-[acyl-carrier-protein] synthase-3